MIRVPVRPLACAGLAVIGWAGAFLGDGSDQWLMMVMVLWGAAGAVLSYPLWSRISMPSPGFGRGRRAVKVTTIRHDYLTAFWLWVEQYVPRIRRIREAYADKLRITGAGLTYDHDLHARRAVHLALTLAPLAAIPVIFGDIQLAPAAAGPAVVVYPMMQLWSRVRQHAVQIGEEMSFFLSYLTTMQNVGYTLYAALERVRDAPDVFVAMTRDATSVTNKVELGTPQMTALREYAAFHPVQEFKDFLHGYISKHETVGPVPSYTESKAEQFFHSYGEAWKRYKETAMMMATMAVMMSVMMPMMMVMMVFITTASTANMMFSLGPLMGPMFAMGLIFMIQSAQPSTGVKLKPWLPSVGVGIATVVLVQMLMMSVTPGDDIWDTEPGISVSLGFVAAGASNYFMVRKQLGGTANVDRGLPEFLEDVTEQTLAGSSITTILKQQAKSGVYSGLFGKLITGIAFRLEAGATMENACAEARKHSRYLAFTLFIIIQLQKIGAASPIVLKQMTAFMSNIVVTKTDVVKSLRVGAMMIYIAPVMLMGIAYGMFSVFEGGSSMDTLSSVLPPGMMDGLSPPDPDMNYKQRLGVLAALITCPMGLVAAKISKFTVVDTMPVVIVGSINVATILLLPIMFEAMQV